MLGPVAADRLLPEEVRRLAPDLVVCDLASPDRDMLEQMGGISRDQAKPIVMFVGEGGADRMTEAIQAGVAAYVMEGVNPQRVRPILDVAIAQFKEFQGLRAKLAETEATLADRKLIDRAKGVLMRQRAMTEEDAFKALRRMAMDRNLKLGEAAQQIISVAELLSK